MFEIFINVELMRNHLGIDWPGGFEQHPFIDLSLLPNNEYRLTLLMLHLHGRTTDKVKKYEMNGNYQALYPDANPEKLIRDGLLRYSTDREAMESNTVRELNGLAVMLGFNINKRSKRQDILDTMLPYASSPIIKDEINACRVFQLTDKGYVIARSLYAEREALERTIYGLLIDDKPKGAINLWEAYKSKQYGQPISTSKSLLSIRIADKNQRALLACSELYGGPPMFYPIEKATPQAVYEKLILHTQDTLSSYKSISITKYESHCVCDSMTCKICSQHDGVVRDLKDAEIGKNCPPFHEGCRCDIGAVIEGSIRKTTGRFARNPLTDKSETTCAKTYRLWQKSLDGEELNALIKKRGWK